MPNWTRFLYTTLPTAVFVLALVAGGTWCSYWADHRTDQFQLIHLGQTVADGGKMYVDCWENKPPGIAWINAGGLWLTGGREVGPWILIGLIAVGSLAVFALALRRLLGTSTANIGVLLAAVVYTLRNYDTPSINPDSYSSLFELAAISFWLLAISTGRGRSVFFWGLVAGLSWAASVSLKQTGAVGLLSVSGVALVMLAVHTPLAIRWMWTTAFTWLGFALGVGAICGVLYHQETGQAAWEAVFAFNKDFASPERLIGAVKSWADGWRNLQPVQLYLWLALIGLVATLRRRTKATHNGTNAPSLSRPLVCALLLWWLMQSLLAQIGPSGSARYWLASFPPMLWLAAIGLAHIGDGLRRLGAGHRSAYGLVCLTAVVLLGRPTLDQQLLGAASSHLAYSREDTQRDRLRTLGDRVAELAPQDAGLYVWSYDTGIYLFAHRRCAGRFTYPRSAAQMEEILSDLESGKASIWLIPQKGSAVFDKWCDDACHTRLGEMLSRYELLDTLEGYLIYRAGANADAQSTMTQ